MADRLAFGALGPVYVNETGSRDANAFGAYVAEAAGSVATTDALMTFAGISFDIDAAAIRETVVVLGFTGISISGILSVAHSAAVTMAFAGISMRASVLASPAAGSGRRSFWTFGA